jgi:transposase
MNYKQKDKKNQRIQQITDQTLIVGADIAKKTHYARAVDFRGIELGKRCIFENHRQGLLKLVLWMKELQKVHGKSEILFGIEPTGHYWFPLAEFLRKNGIKVVLVNPHHVNKSKELEDNSQTKNDLKDAKVIANLIKNGDYTEPKLPTDIFADLRVMMNLREKVSNSLSQAKIRVQNWLDRFFPEYSQVFSSWDGKASLMTLKEFPLPQEIVSLGAEEVLRRWKTQVKRAVGIKRARKLVEYASTSIGITEGCVGAKLELAVLLEQYELYTKQLEQIMEEVQTLLNRIPGTKEMMSIPGVAEVTLAGFLAEVGNLEDYTHPQQIIRLAGLNLRENSSGKHKGKTTISKRGRARLRALLFRCVLPMVSKNKEFKYLHEYYTKRKERPLKKKQSIIALCGKLIRVLYYLGTRKESYDGKNVLGPMHSIQQLQAA